MEIADALYNYCGIPGELYFVAVRAPDGDVTTFFSPGRLSHDDAESSFFDVEKFKQVSRQPDPSMYERCGDCEPNLSLSQMARRSPRRLLTQH
jgi:hypothetical protein